MRSLRRRLRSFASAYGVDLGKVRHSIAGRGAYRRNRREFARLREDPALTNVFPMGAAWPCFADRFDGGGVAGGHYFHQDLLVAQWIFAANPVRHIDVGSRLDGFAAHVASFREVEVLDIRANQTSATGLKFHQRDIMVADPAWDDCCDSLSCLHTIEHFGLGRYGDALDPDGWKVGWRNLVRMVRQGGVIYLSTMIGRQRIEFDAHRVFAVPTVLALVADTCEVESVALVGDLGELHLDLDHTGPAAARSFDCEAGCLILRLRRRETSASRPPSGS
ncbi:hypothetical protein BH10ACT2_BH10ACT2_01450 [soil metagenome]